MSRQRSVFIKNWIVDACVGLYPHEYEKPQRLRLTITLQQADFIPFRSDDVAKVIDYGAHKQRLTALIHDKHVPLLETLADMLAENCLTDPLVESVSVHIEKLDIFPDAICGVQLERRRGDYT